MQQHVFAISQTCASSGIKHAIICPGSRSAPLVFAFTQAGITCHSVVDERSAGYMALGMAQQLREPVALICTSGTASLNFFPSIAEAFYQKIALLVLTADRPPELLNQQDGQMIMQKDVYGSHVLASYELPCYTHGKENINETVTIVSKALVQSMGERNGPVHINVPLCEPLYPEKGNTVKLKLPEQPALLPAEAMPVTDVVKKSVLKAWMGNAKKMVLVGQMPVSGALNGALTELSKHPDVVILCDVLSNEFEFNTALHFDYLLTRADAETQEALQPDCIISLGGPVLSKSLKLWLQKQKPLHHFRINAGDEKVDTYKNVTQHIKGNAPGLLYSLALQTGNLSDEKNYFRSFWETADVVVAKAINTFATNGQWSELHAMDLVLQAIPDAANVQVGNSSIIRYASHLARINPSWVMSGNRGTSGIDGCTSTAVGAAKVNNRPTVLLTGDIAFLYDINALWQKELPHNLKIVVFNNEGGGIFQLIDGPSRHIQQLDYFTTPHTQSIKQIALQKGMEYYFCGSQNNWNKDAKPFFANSSKPALLELKFDRTTNAKLFQAFKQITL
jgi:2-succinyl-5-enolpyruvyl-6-hydroxy-3-cyclohexene-1-carboxylate synthase